MNRFSTSWTEASFDLHISTTQANDVTTFKVAESVLFIVKRLKADDTFGAHFINKLKFRSRI